jgi:hypothetical protein
MSEEIKNDDIYLSISSSIVKIENSLPLSNIDEYYEIINTEVKKAFQIIYSISYKTIETLQNELCKTNIDRFAIINSNRDSLTLAGSFDFCYYHEIEIEFLDVEFIFCPGGIFSVNCIRVASETEINELSKSLNGYSKRGFVVCLENRFKEKFYIISQQVNYRWGMVYYYLRENLQDGERIAEWALKEKD